MLSNTPKCTHHSAWSVSVCFIFSTNNVPHSPTLVLQRVSSLHRQISADRWVSKGLDFQRIGFPVALEQSACERVRRLHVVLTKEESLRDHQKGSTLATKQALKTPGKAAAALPGRDPRSRHVCLQRPGFRWDKTTGNPSNWKSNRVEIQMSQNARTAAPLATEKRCRPCTQCGQHICLTNKLGGGHP
jgi:hypothetical protein